MPFTHENVRPFTDLFLGRQPILASNGATFAYEMTYRHDPQHNLDDVAWSVVRAVSADIENLGAGAQQLMLPSTPRLLCNDVFADLPPARILIRVDATDLDAASMDALSDLSARGAGICLTEDPSNPRPEHQLALASILRIDAHDHLPSVVAPLVARHHASGLAVLASNVASHDQRRSFSLVGVDLFQGLFLSEPRDLTSGLPDSRIATLQLLVALSDDEYSVDDLERAVSQNIQLSIQVLRYVNSAFVGLRSKVSSIRQALVLLGPSVVRQIASVALVSSGGGANAPEVTRQTLVRARFCDEMARLDGEAPGAYYTAGMFSGLEAVLCVPLTELLDGLPLTDEVVDAVISQAGPIGRAVRIAAAYERSDWDDPVLAESDAAKLTGAYLSALTWVDQIMSALG